jgi:hypothetical protein
VRHKRDWQSSVNVKSTKFAAHMARLSSRTSGCQPDKGEPSNMGESAVMANLVTNARVTGQLILADIVSPHQLHPGPPVENEPDQINSDSLSESEGLASASLSNYDCDSEGGASEDDVDSESDDVGGSCRPGAMNLKFQLDAAKAGELCIAHPI